MMMSGRFVPGQKLPLRPLAEEFNTSLMPVRDALNRLVRQRPDIGVVIYRNLAAQLGAKLLRADHDLAGNRRH